MHAICVASSLTILAHALHVLTCLYCVVPQQMAVAEAEMLKDIMENISHPNVMHIERVFQVSGVLLTVCTQLFWAVGAVLLWL
jgi:hypothetical protein